MKARLPARLTNKQKTAIREGVAAEMRRQEEGNIRRIFKLLCASLHEEYGFGQVRCRRIIANVSRLADQHEHDEVFWAHVDQLMAQIGMDFVNENYEVVDR